MSTDSTRSANVSIHSATIDMKKAPRRGGYATRFKGQEGNRVSTSQYLTNLSSSVNAACDAWLEKKGLKGKSWKEVEKNRPCAGAQKKGRTD